MNDLNTKYFFADTLEQAVMQAARHYEIHPDEVAYSRVEKRHGFLRLRRRVVIEVDPDQPRRPPSREPDHTLTSSLPETQSKRGRRKRGGGPSGRPKGKQKGKPRRGRGSPGRQRGESRGGRADKGSSEPSRGKPEPEPKPKPKRDRRSEAVREPQPPARPESRQQPSTASDADGLVELPAALKRATERYPEATGETADAARAAVRQLLEFGGLDLDSAVLQGEDRLEVELWGADQKRVLANHGQALLAIQHLLPRLVRDEVGEGVPCRVDCDNFHEIREEQLRDLAQRAANEVSRNGRSKTLAPMRPAERRIVHMALSDDPQVVTQSRGRGLFKRVEVRPRS